MHDGASAQSCAETVLTLYMGVKQTKVKREKRTKNSLTSVSIGIVYLRAKFCMAPVKNDCVK